MCASEPSNVLVIGAVIVAVAVIWGVVRVAVAIVKEVL
jgi:hypothetical protein